jgi:hypothetical protein
MIYLSIFFNHSKKRMTWRNGLDVVLDRVKGKLGARSVPFLLSSHIRISGVPGSAQSYQYFITLA